LYLYFIFFYLSIPISIVKILLQDMVAKTAVMKVSNSKSIVSSIENTDCAMRDEEDDENKLMSDDDEDNGNDDEDDDMESAGEIDEEQMLSEDEEDVNTCVSEQEVGVSSEEIPVNLVDCETVGGLPSDDKKLTLCTTRDTNSIKRAKSDDTDISAMDTVNVLPDCTPIEQTDHNSNETGEVYGDSIDAKDGNEDQPPHINASNTDKVCVGGNSEINDVVGGEDEDASADDADKQHSGTEIGGAVADEDTDVCAFNNEAQRSTKLTSSVGKSAGLARINTHEADRNASTVKRALFTTGRGQLPTRVKVPVPKRHVAAARKRLPSWHGGITDPALRRLARRGGVKRMNEFTYDEIRTVLRSFLSDVVRDTVRYTEYAHRKTVTSSDVVHGLKHRGITLYGFGA
jgi:histone H4